jgi:allantoin racemase
VTDEIPSRRRRILVIDPVGTDQWVASDSAYVRGKAWAGTVVDFAPLDDGPLSLESAADETRAVPGVVRRGLQMATGHDGILVNCFLDPGVQALRELVDVPVAGPGESGMVIASLLGHRFSILCVARNLVPRHERQARVLGFDERLASVIDIGIPVLDLEANAARTVDTVVARAREAVEADGAEVILLGCTGLAALAQAIRERLAVPVVEPLSAALKLLETEIDLGLAHSRAALYRRPEVAKISGWGLSG